MDLETKLAILADAAKYDASCASSGSRGRRAGPRGIGSTEGMGICHSYTPDGRCVSLLKLLLTNYCIYDCSYCINRRSSGVRRARFTPDDVVRLTLEFYRRNYIEGLFLSSGIIRGPDYTMEQLVAVARRLRRDHEFAGYIHLKTIPNASAELIREAGRYADRLSINVEVPRQRDLDALAPDKELLQITRAMAVVRDGIAEAKEKERAPAFVPAGQATQMIVGATEASDATILDATAELYATERAVTSSRLAVIRLHGRRRETWEARNDPATERYRYLYDDSELAEHLRRIIELSERKQNAVHVIYNNCHGNYAVTNAAELTYLLLGRDRPEGEPGHGTSG